VVFDKKRRVKNLIQYIIPDPSKRSDNIKKL